MDFNNQIETLILLGLTGNQAKIFIALVQSEPSTVTQIAKATNLAREVVYRTMPRLQKLGIVTKAITFPTEFNAISIDLATKILLEKRAKETREAEAKATELVNQLKNRFEVKNQKEAQVISIFGRERLNLFLERQMLTAQKSVDSLILGSMFYSWWDKNCPILKKLLAKNVLVRVIIACGNERSCDKNLEEIKGYPNFSVKYLSDPIQTLVGIIDNRDILINTTPGKASIYWSNDPGVIALCKIYFEKYWNSIRITEQTRG